MVMVNKFFLSVSVATAAAFMAMADHVPVKQGLWKVFKYDNPSDEPIVFSGWSKATDAHALEYCMFLDVFYADGTAAWARKANFTLGTHDWEETKKVFIPKKPW